MLPAAVLATGLALAGCGSDNEPAVTNGDDDSSANSSSNTSASNGSGGSSSTSASADTSSTDTSSGGSSSGGTSTTASGTLGQPPCGNNIAGMEIKKGTACTEDDVELCYRTCGPQSIGWKTEICTGGVYVEGDCQFPPEESYECYAIPDAIDASCPADPPQASTDCDVAECTLCNAGGEYLDSGGSVKIGYCVCQQPKADGSRTWSCGSDVAWPCPSGMGC
jgi:hypothetical protein